MSATLRKRIRPNWNFRTDPHISPPARGEDPRDLNMTHYAMPLSARKTCRSYNINMPQMAMGGLSESWLFRELGDMHWQMITNGLQCPSIELSDPAGNRLYATFTRISVSSSALASYEENEPFDLEGDLFRFGPGIYFSEINFTNGRASIMSSISMRGENRSNVYLLKGQPKIPPNCKIAKRQTLPQFGQDYISVRASYPSSDIFSCEYEIIPQYDINGVGLLYFAAYPIISDICQERFASQRNLSTMKRDVFYFRNCDPGETLVFRIDCRESSDLLVESETSISRKSDGILMARSSRQKH
jgi:probable biosynthetic protein (TIGR04098 family)